MFPVTCRSKPGVLRTRMLRTPCNTIKDCAAKHSCDRELCVPATQAKAIAKSHCHCASPAPFFVMAHCNVRAFFLQNFLWHRQWRNYESKVTHTCHANITCPLATCSRRKPPAQSESAAASKLLEGIGNRLAWHSERQSPSSACPASWVPSSSSKVRYCPRLQTQAMCEHVSLQTSW